MYNERPDIRVFLPSGRAASYRVSGGEARHLIRSGMASGIGTRQRLRAIQMFTGPSRPVAGTKYVTDSDTPTNVKNVFAFKPISHLDERLFRAVQSDCLADFKQPRIVNTPRDPELEELEMSEQLLETLESGMNTEAFA